MEDRRGVLKLSFLADDRRFAKTFDRRRCDAQRRYCHLPEQGAKFVADIDQHRKVLAIAPGIRVCDHRERRRLAGRRIDQPTHLALGRLDESEKLANV